MRRACLNRLLIAQLLIVGAVTARSQGVQKPWDLKKDQDGIRVYSRPTERSRFNTMKVETILSCKASALAALLLDIENYPNWSFNTQEANVLKQQSPSDLYFYSHIHSPWPATDRDLIVHLRITQDSAKGMMTVLSESVPDFIPPKKDRVRVPMSTEQWVVQSLPDGKQLVNYQLEIDPGASAPAWLVNIFATRGPYETFVHLREQLNKPKYRDARISFKKF